LFEKTGDQRRTVYTLGELGFVSVVQDRDEDARIFFSQALETASRTCTLSLAQDVLTCIAAAYAHRDENLEAARLLGLVLSSPVADQLTARRANRLFEKMPADVQQQSTVAGSGSPGGELIWNEVASLIKTEIHP